VKLYELTTEYRLLADLILAGDGDEVPENVSATLDRIEGDLSDKVRNIVALRREWITEAEGLRAEAARLAAMAKARENAADRLQAYCVRCLDAAGVESVRTDLGRVQVQAASRPSIRWDGEGSIPDDFTRTKVELDGQAAYEAWKDGWLPEGFRVERSRGLRVY
jgi:hypothetical protein